MGGERPVALITGARYEEKERGEPLYTTARYLAVAVHKSTTIASPG